MGVLQKKKEYKITGDQICPGSVQNAALQILETKILLNSYNFI